MNDISFSIILPTYNRVHLIDKAIQSVIDQDYKNWELIIIDNYSNDNTEEVVKSFSDETFELSVQGTQEILTIGGIQKN